MSYWGDLASLNMQGPRLADGSFTWITHDVQETPGHYWCRECKYCWTCGKEHT